jgi:hypothetical protein
LELQVQVWVAHQNVHHVKVQPVRVALAKECHHAQVKVNAPVVQAAQVVPVAQVKVNALAVQAAQVKVNAPAVQAAQVVQVAQAAVRAQVVSHQQVHQLPEVQRGRAVELADAVMLPAHLVVAVSQADQRLRNQNAPSVKNSTT